MGLRTKTIYAVDQTLSSLLRNSAMAAGGRKGSGYARLIAVVNKLAALSVHTWSQFVQLLWKY